MKKTPKNSIAVVTLYDWQGLYVNGELKLERASTINTDIIKVLGWEVHYHYPGGLPKTKCQKYYDKYRCLPKKLVDAFEK